MFVVAADTGMVAFVGRPAVAGCDPDDNVVNGMGAFGCRQLRSVHPECIAMERTTSALAHRCPTLGE